MLRGSNVPNLRLTYDCYDQMECVGKNGDCYDRYL